jgi:hypothetical protein
VFHPLSQIVFSRQSAILVRVPPFFYSSPVTGTVHSSVPKYSAWVYTWKVIVVIIFAPCNFLSYGGCP